MGFPVIPYDLCGSQENLNARTSSRQHLPDGNLFDFKNIQLGAVVEEGDIAFDD